MTCSCTTEPLGTLANPFVVRPGASWSIRLRFFLVRESEVVVVPEGGDEPCDGDLINLTTPARTGVAQLRPDLDQQGDPTAELVVTIAEPQAGRRRGLVTVSMPATTSLFPYMAPRIYVFDVRLVADADETDVLGSQVFYLQVPPGVTR
jgi:hypothetical protein